MKKSLTYIILTVLTWPVLGQPSSSVLQVDYKKIISQADLLYEQPVTRSEEGMPVGNGRMGSLVWTTPTSLKFQLNRVDVFANNSDSDNFFERHSDYCGGVGSVAIDFVGYGEEVFTGENFRQHLSCYDGIISTEGKGISTKVVAWHEQDVMAIQVTDSRTNPQPVNIDLSMLRSLVVKRGDHSAISEHQVLKDRIILTQRFEEDEYYCGSAVVIGVSGRNVQASVTNDFTVQLVASPGAGTFSIFIATAAGLDKEEDLVDKASRQLEVAMGTGYDQLTISNKQWWHSFWEKSFISLHSQDGVADYIQQNYHYYLYVMAATSRGKYPPKFNGMLWTTGGDARKWGSLYWGANQSCLYNGLFPTNHLELMDPMFDMYSSAYNSFEIAAQQQWSSKGIFIPETVGFDGIPELPEEIAKEMQELYLCKKPWEERSKRFEDYAFTKLPYHSRWNWKADAGWKDGQWHIADKEGGAFGHVTHIFSRGAKIAYQYWMRYEYTLDKEWLKERAYPMLKGVAEFYRNFPNVKKEQDGRYHIYHVNDNESIWDGHNTVEELASMMAIFPVVIKASEILGVDADMRPVWQEFADNLAPWPTNLDFPERSEQGEDLRWTKSLPGAVHGNGFGPPDPNTMPLWFFDLVTLESDDPQRLEIARSTFDHFFQEGINENSKVYVLSKLPVAGVQLGRVEAAKYLIPNQIRTAEIDVMPNRMDLREGYQTTSVQRLGRAADALHNALCQSVPPAPGQEPVIRVFPAWPEEWDAQYSLLCRGATVVSSSMQKGEIQFVEIHSQKGGECRVRNPWEGPVTIYRNGRKWKTTSDDLVIFPTKEDDRFVMVPEGKTPDQLKEFLQRN